MTDISDLRSSTNQADAAGAAATQATARLLVHYEQMIGIRAFEQAVLALHAEGKVAGSVHPAIGQEAVPVGALAALGSNDPVVCTYRGHGWALACGLDRTQLLAEIAGRVGGTNGGRAGSALLSDPGTRFIGENSIVGAGLPIANGAALASLTLGRGEVTIVSFGDGATNQGASHEALVFAIAQNLPVVFVCENNQWSEMTPISRTVPTSLTSRAQAYGLAAECIDGSDVEVVEAAVSRAAARAREGRGPTFLECTVPRIGGHYNADVEHYRTDEDRREAAERDPLPKTRRALLNRGVSDVQLDEIETRVDVKLSAALDAVQAMPQPDPATATHHVVVTTAPRPSPLPDTGHEITYGKAINDALHREMTDRTNVIVFGEDVAIPGGVFGVTRNLAKEFGSDRVFDTPISEAAILGAALGSSLRGLRPVVEIMWMDFLMVAMDQLVNQAANVRYLSGGRISAPLLVRTQQGVTAGSCAQHSQSLEALLAHIPGLKVGMPSTAHDAYAMTRAAIADDDPVLLIESRALYQTRGVVDPDQEVEPVGGARLRKTGRDLLMVSWGRMTLECLAAAAELEEDGVQAGVIDLRWLSPLDFDLVRTQLPAHGGKVLIVHEANRSGGFGAEIAARVAEECLYELDHPIVRLATPDVRMPAAPALQAALVPDKEQIVQTARLIASS